MKRAHAHVTRVHRGASRKLVERYLAAYGVQDVQTAANRVRRRVGRYDAPVPCLWPFLAWLFDLAAPLVALSRARHAHSLNARDFDRLEHTLQNHRVPLARALLMLVRLPILEAVYEDRHVRSRSRPPVGRDPIGHPLPTRRRSAEHERPSDYDVIVIGSGAGGAPVAWELSRRGLRVAIVEAGGFVLPETSGRAIEKYYLRQAMTFSVQSGFLPVLAGCAVGGTTAINSGTALRPSPEWLARWDERLGTDFANGALVPFLHEVERVAGIGAPSRTLLSEPTRRFERGLLALGRTGAHLLPRAARDCEGSGICCFGCPTGAKQGTDRTFLPEAVRSGAVLWQHTQALAVREGASDAHVVVRHAGGTHALRARHVVLAAGALLTPGLIRRNALGPRWRHAGQHLKIHPATKVLAFFDDPVYPERGIPQSLGYEPPDIARVVLEGIATPRAIMATVLPAVGAHGRWWLERFEHVGSFGLMLRDRSIGSVREIAGWPCISYSTSPEDAHDIAAGVRLIAQAWFAAGARRVLLPFVRMRNEYSSAIDLARFREQDVTPERLCTTGFHPQGTAGIGRIVDADLRLTPLVSVCDASVLPDSPGVNPQLVIMALSLRLAARLAAELGR
jgi:hypothetical protein